MQAFRYIFQVVYSSNCFSNIITIILKVRNQDKVDIKYIYLPLMNNIVIIIVTFKVINKFFTIIITW